MSYNVEMVHVSSSFIRAIGYDGSTLYVEMRNGKSYDHPGVPYYHFEGLLRASSKGTYFNHYIRGRYK
jgi:hypothetical protein